MALTPEKELQARRLIAQGLAGSQARSCLNSPRNVIEHLLAVQGQTYKAGIRALALRIKDGQKASEDLHAADDLVHEAVARHEIVRAWPMRGTLHFMDAQQVRWLMALCSPRVENAASKRRAGLGFAEGDFDIARDALYSALLEFQAGETLERREAYALFDSVGVDSAQGRGPHLMRALGGLGNVVQGSLAGHRETFQHVDRLKVEQREVAEEKALAELGSRYLKGHGPVTVNDLAWWAGLTKRDCKKALETAADSATITIGETEYFIPRWQLEVSHEEMEAALAQTFYLPAFDEYLLGYSDKSFTMADEIRHAVLTKNGISWDFTVKNGAVVGRTR